ncbi:MAG: hypothetical protein IKR53_01645, partial [Clostridia bacterium]|nr:hypothetical protein [Clostridia bacterium]
YKSWGNDQRQGGDHAQIVLSDESIRDSGGGDVPTSDTYTVGPITTDTDPDGNPVPTETDPEGNPIPVQTETDPEGNPIPVDTGANNGGNNGGTAPRTGDPMIIIAAVSALGACGAFVIKRRRG